MRRGTRKAPQTKVRRKTQQKIQQRTFAAFLIVGGLNFSVDVKNDSVGPGYPGEP